MNDLDLSLLIRLEAEERKVKHIPLPFLIQEVIEELVSAGFLSTPKGDRQLVTKPGNIPNMEILMLICPKCNQPKRILHAPDLLCRKCSKIHHKKLGPIEQSLFYIKKAQIAKNRSKAQEYIDKAEALIKPIKKKMAPKRKKPPLSENDVVPDWA